MSSTREESSEVDVALGGVDRLPITTLIRFSCFSHATMTNVTKSLKD